MKNLARLFILLICLVYFSASFRSVAQPNVGQTLPRKPNNGIYVIAHRGVHNSIPENSLPAYQKAIELGCDYVEIDVRTTRDGKFISMHNPSVEQYVPGHKGKVSEMTLAEIKSLDIGFKTGPDWKGTRVPTFEEILELCRGKIGIYLDLKDAPVPELLTIIRRYGMEKEIIWYIESDRKELQQLQSLCSECFPLPDPGPEKNIATVLQMIKTPIIATDMSRLNKTFIETAQRNKVLVFTDDDKATEEEWNRILDLKVAGIQTDEPEKLIGFLKKKKK